MGGTCSKSEENEGKSGCVGKTISLQRAEAPPAAGHDDEPVELQVQLADGSLHKETVTMSETVWALQKRTACRILGRTKLPDAWVDRLPIYFANYPLESNQRWTDVGVCEGSIIVAENFAKLSLGSAKTAEGAPVASVALREVLAAVERDPEEGPLWLNLANTLATSLMSVQSQGGPDNQLGTVQVRGQSYTRQECHLKFQELSPNMNCADYWFSLGWCGGGDSFTQEECLKYSLNIDPDHAAAWNSMGTIADSDCDRALECFIKAVTLDPQYAMAWRNLSLYEEAGFTFEKSHTRYGKRQCLENALNIDPAFIAAWKDLERAGGGTVSSRHYTPEGCRQQLEFLQNVD